MKKNSITITVSLLLMVIFIACNKKEEPPTENERSLTTISGSIDDPTASLTFKVILTPSDINYIENNVITGAIADLWSKRSGCKKIGICKWFPKVFEPADPNVYSDLLIGRSVIFPIILDANGNIKPITLAFTSTPDFLEEDDKVFRIDEDFFIEVTDNMNLPFNQLIINQGDVNFDPNIGEFGGYHVQIVGS